MDLDDLESELGEDTPPKAHLARTGKSAVVRIDVPSVDRFDLVDEQVELVEAGLEAAQVLQEWSYEPKPTAGARGSSLASFLRQLLRFGVRAIQAGLNPETPEQGALNETPRVWAERKSGRR